jgi:hypothetical protein
MILGQNISCVRLAPWGLVVAVLAGGCEAPEDEFSDDPPLAEEALEDKELDAFVSELEDGDVVALRDLLPMLSPDALPDDLVLEDLGPEALDMPVIISSTGEYDASGHVGADAFATASDPSAIGEPACSTTSIADPADGAQVAMSTAPHCGLAWDGAISPDTSYDPVGCPHQYVTEVTGTYGRPLNFYWRWHGATLDQNTCSLTHANLSAYGGFPYFNPATNTLAWSWASFGTMRVHGKWVAVPGGIATCEWELDNGSARLPTLGRGHGYWTVRTAAQATGFIFKQPVESGVQHGQGPC